MVQKVMSSEVGMLPEVDMVAGKQEIITYQATEQLDT